MIHLVADFSTWLTAVSHANDVLQAVHAPMPDDWMFVAQQIKQTDLMGDVGKTWNHFVRTGQVWAFMIGIVIGYMVKTFTSFG